MSWKHSQPTALTGAGNIVYLRSLPGIGRLVCDIVLLDRISDILGLLPTDSHRGRIDESHCNVFWSGGNWTWKEENLLILRIKVIRIMGWWAFEPRLPSNENLVSSKRWKEEIFLLRALGETSQPEDVFMPKYVASRLSQVGLRKILLSFHSTFNT